MKFLPSNEFVYIPLCCVFYFVNKKYTKCLVSKSPYTHWWWKSTNVVHIWSCLLSHKKKRKIYDRVWVHGVMVLVTILTLFFPFFQTRWVSLFLVCCFGCFELSRENAKMVEIHREKRKREATKIINTENGRREKKRSALLSQWSVAYNRQKWLLFYDCLRLGLSPLIFITRRQHSRLRLFFLFFFFSFWWH